MKVSEHYLRKQEISKIKTPRNTDEVRAFLGLLNYYRRFIPAFSDLMHLIQKLLKKNVKFEWTEEYDVAFKTGKETLMRNPMLYHPDPNTPMDHRNRCQQDSICRHATTAIHSRWDKTGSPSGIHIIQLHRYPTSLECHRKRTLHNLCGNVKRQCDKSVTIRTDHKTLLEIVAGMAKSQNSAAADKFRHWTSDILTGDPHPTIQYKKGSLNLIADSL